jgi:trehalose 6-phosphate phosphatase
MLTGIGPDDGITLIGSHGAQSNRPERRELGSAPGATGLDEAGAALLATLRDELEAIGSGHPSVRLEYKPAAVVLHTRDVEPSTAEAATEAAHEVGRRHGGVRVIPGKDVVELTVSAADKGSALVHLAHASSSDATLYVGDDVTDERAFAALHPSSGDLTIKVGTGETVALHRVPDPETAVKVLRMFLEMRRAQS